MKTGTITYALLLMLSMAVVTLPAGGSRAQNDIDRNRAEHEIEVTDEVIHKATDVINESRSQKGRIKLSQAKAIQDKAKASLSASANRMAVNLTLQAREEAYEAMAIARIETNTETRLTRLVEEIIDRLAKVRDIMMENNIRAERVMKLVEEARNLLEKSRVNANQYRYQLAVKLAESARQRAIGAEQEVRRIRALKEMTERRLELMDRLMERARDRVRESDNQRAERQLRLAEEQLEKAKQMQRDGKYRAARLVIEKCEKTFRSLIRRFRMQTAHDPGAQLEETYRLLERVEEKISQSGDEPDRRHTELLDRAKDLMMKAEGNITLGKHEEAKRLLTEARRTLRKIVREERQEMNGERITARIQEIERLRGEVATVMESCDAPGVSTLMERATNHLEKAKALAEDGDLRGAGAKARIAENMFNRIREICSTL